MDGFISGQGLFEGNGECDIEPSNIISDEYYYYYCVIIWLYGLRQPED